MNPEEIGRQLEQYDFDYFMTSALDKIPAGTTDTREGSIIYDALAPACYQMAEFVMQLKTVMLETFTQTATASYLDLRAEEHGIKRIAATRAIVRGIFAKDDETAMVLVEGDRFSSISDNPVYYTVIQPLEAPGEYNLLAETPGQVGNQYVGTLLPIDNYNGLATAELLEIVIPARDEETDDSLRERILKTYQINIFGGNIEDYINFTSKIDGVGAVQVYPIWAGGGTVKLAILNNAFDLPNQTLIDNVQNLISPTPELGYGIAPIGHKVTVAGPTRKNINVSLHVDAVVGYTVDSLKPQILSALQNYFLQIRKQWSAHNDLYQYQQTLYRSQVIVTLLQIEGVANVTDVRFNNLAQDINLVMSGTLQECAHLGAVTYT